METLHGYGVVQGETIGQDVIQARVLLGRVVPVMSVIHPTVRHPQIFTAMRWQTEIRGLLRVAHNT